MEKIFILLAIFTMELLSRADLIIQQQGISDGVTNNVTVSIHENWKREDVVSDQIGQFSIINDMNTFDQTILEFKTKTFRITSGSKVKEFIRKSEDNSGDKNTVSEPSDTGMRERVGEFETKIFIWTNGKNITNRLWVAQNYPNYDAIKPCLLRLDEFRRQGLDKMNEPPVAGLPGMVVKKEQIIRGQSRVVKLIATKTEPVEASLFEIPSGYTEYKSQTTRSP